MIFSHEVRPVVGYEGFYRVWSNGAIQTCRKPGSWRVTDHWRDLKPVMCGGVRPHVNLCRGGVISRVQVSEIVLSAFVGPRPDGMEACHYPDPDPLNNDVRNLRWDTHKENCQDIIRMGRMPRGSSRAHSKLTAEDIFEIRRLCSSGMKQADVAKIFGVNQTTVGRINRRIKWSHV